MEGKECRVWVRLPGSHPGTAAGQLCGLGSITQSNPMGGWNGNFIPLNCRVEAVSQAVLVTCARNTAGAGLQ